MSPEYKHSTLHCNEKKHFVCILGSSACLYIVCMINNVCVYLIWSFNIPVFLHSFLMTQPQVNGLQDSARHCPQELPGGK